MKKYQGYKIAIWVLSFMVIFEGVFIILLNRPKKVPPEIPLAVKGKIAIVIDDWGYNLNNLYILDEIKYPLTISVLPNLAYSKALAEGLHKRGFEIILHLPMEPHEKFKLEQNTIMTFMNESKIRSIIEQDLANLPNILGVSNHMGSKATEDVKTTAVIFKELKKRNLYFLDSLVSKKSICRDMAYKMQIGFAKRDVFLDNQGKAEYIKNQIQKLRRITQAQGKAIGIGHDRKITLEILKEVMPALEKDGYKFVFVSELIR